ncbi:MAG: PilZ domain-containing protein [Gammaproteobacteria bacterium]|nr:PilZ domain-containing protein [Gammaproteobacteria bacterium]
MPQTHRSEERVSMKVPVTLPGGVTGITRDISASGIYFETDSEPVGDSPLAFTVEFKNEVGVGMTLRCRGQVLRVEHQGSRVGVAARILESKLEPGRPQAQEIRKLVISDGFADSF